MNKPHIHYEITGAGEPCLLFLHGWQGSTASFYFAQQHMAKQYTAVNIDLPNFGKSEKLAHAADVYFYALLLVKFIREHNLKNITVVAHSFGGRIAIILAALANVDIKRLIVTGGAGLKPRWNFFVKTKIGIFKLLKKWFPKKQFKKFGSADYRALNPVMQKTLVCVVNQNLKYLLCYITASVLLIWGRFDKSTPLYMAKQMKKNIKNSKLIILPGGHFAYLENKEAFIQAADLFIRGC